ncbi:MAG: TIGR00159 family protein [Ruminococcaceae bacterium]|nr:TIGR00159 family protein [Oscillospiraceae bacterium]
MEAVVKEFLQLLAGMKFMDYLDILIVAFLLYQLFPLLRSTNSIRVAGVIVAIIVISWITDVVNLNTLSFILDEFLQVGVIALVVLFQPELRRMLDHLGSVRLEKILTPEKVAQDMKPVISQAVRACEVMSREKIGALIVFGRESRLDEYFKTGTMIDGQVSEQLLRNIFFPKAALHDGAMIILGGKVAAAGCVLPLSDSHRLSADLGTRHRAGVGMSEATDAVVVIVSEETGTISVAVGGMLKRHLAPQTLEKLLIHELCPAEAVPADSLTVRLKQKLKKKDKEETK